MIIDTLGDKNKPAILFFHAMGVTGQSSVPVAEYLKDRYFCIMPTSTVYCENQTYQSKLDEIHQIEKFLMKNGIESLELIVASSLGADLAMEFLTKSPIPVNHVFFDGGQFAQIKKCVRSIMVPFLFLAIKSLYWSKGGTLKKILWCDDENIKPYFIEAGKNITYKNLKAQLSESLEDKPFPSLNKELQEKTYWEFGSVEEHLKYREAVMETYTHGNFPIFDGFNHMQFQIKDPEGFSKMLVSIINENKLPSLPFLQI